MIHEPGTNLCGNGKSGRDRDTDTAHFGQSGSFSAEKIAHGGIAFGFSASEEVIRLIFKQFFC